MTLDEWRKDARKKQVGMVWRLRRIPSALRDWYYECVYAWQRMFRGWDDTVVIGGVGLYLSRTMPQWLRAIKEYGYPSSACYARPPSEIEYTEEETQAARREWNELLDTMIEGFEAAERHYGIECWSHPEEDDFKFKRAMRLFERFYHSLDT